jgi:hypothetical protein
MAHEDDDPPWTRQLLVAVGVLVIGGVASVVALGAAKVTGLGSSSGPTTTARPSLYLPSGRPTTRIDPYPAPSGSSPSGSATTGAQPRPKPTRKPKPPLTLEASPQQVAPSQLITLTGSYRGGSGSRLQVQRLEGSGAGTWTDFPVTAAVTAGRFRTAIRTSHTGVSRLRVLDKATGTASNPVRVTVG